MARRTDVACGAAVAVAALALACLALEIWNADLRVPFAYSGDGTQNQLIVKTVLDHGWYQSNPDLGAPFGLKLYDFPVVSGDNLQIVLMKAIGLFTSDSALVMNLFFLLTFPLTAATAFLSARLIGLGRAASALVALLFALLPYHLIRGENHVFIAAYYAVPLALWLAIGVLRGDPLWGGRRRAWTLVVLALVIGSAHVYYAAFAIALLAVAIVARLLGGTRAGLPGAAAVIALIGAFVVANHLPNLVYRADHGTNTTLERTADQSEAFGLRIAAMTLPVPDHRLAPLRKLRERYTAEAGAQRQEGAPQALGSIATLGLAALLLGALGALAAPARWRDEHAVVVPAAVLALAAIVIGTAGGLSSIFAFVVDPQLRAWGRISVFIAFLGLLAVGVAGERVARARGPRAGAAVLLALLAIGLLDQTNSGVVPDYEQTRTAYHSDQVLVDEIEATLGRGASVFQLPYEPFPEPQPHWMPDMGPYDMARGYLHSHDLKWSYGLMKGRAGDWQHAVVQQPPALLARAVAAAGFTGIYVDRGGYADRGAFILSKLIEETNARAIQSADGRLAFLDLRDYARGVIAAPGASAARTATLRPLGVTYGAGFSALRQDLRGRFYLAAQQAAVDLHNPSARAKRVRVAMALEPAFPQPASVQVTIPGAAAETVRVPLAGTTVEREVTLPPGDSQMVLAVKGHPQVAYPDVPRSYYLRVRDPVVVDSALESLGTLPRDRRAAAFLSPFGAI